MSEYNSNNEEGEELETELPDGVSVNQGVLTTPFGSWPISKISEVKIHMRPFWLTMVIALAAGFVVTQIWVLAHNLDPKSFLANAIYSLTMMWVITTGKIVVKVRTEGIETTVWKESSMFIGRIYTAGSAGSAKHVHEVIAKALSTKAS